MWSHYEACALTSRALETKCIGGIKSHPSKNEGWGTRRCFYASEIKRLGQPSGEIINTMKNRDAKRHPGVMRVMQVDSEFAGLLVAVGFLVMGAIGLDIGKWFVMGALVLGVGVALLLRIIHKSD